MDKWDDDDGMGVYGDNYPYVGGADRDKPWVLTGSALLMAGAAGLLIGYLITWHLIPWLVEAGVG